MIHKETVNSGKLYDLVNYTKLLLIDEMPSAARAMNEWLSHRGFSVVNVNQLDEAIEILNDFTTGACADVVMLSVSMSTASILNVRNTIRLSCEDERVEVFTFSRTTGGTRDQLEKIFGLSVPVSASLRTSSHLPKSA